MSDVNSRGNVPSNPGNQAEQQIEPRIYQWDDWKSNTAPLDLEPGAVIEGIATVEDFDRVNARLYAEMHRQPLPEGVNWSVTAGSTKVASRFDFKQYYGRMTHLRVVVVPPAEQDQDLKGLKGVIPGTRYFRVAFMADMGLMTATVFRTYAMGYQGVTTPQGPDTSIARVVTATQVVGKKRWERILTDSKLIGHLGELAAWEGAFSGGLPGSKGQSRGGDIEMIETDEYEQDLAAQGGQPPAE